MIPQGQSHVSSDLILTVALRCVSHPHSADGDTETQRALVTYSGSHSKQVAQLRWNPSLCSPNAKLSYGAWLV